MKYWTLISVLCSVATAVPRKFLDGHPQDDSWGKLAPAQAAEHQQDFRQQGPQYGTQPTQYNQFSSYQQPNQYSGQSNQYGGQLNQYGGQQNQHAGVSPYMAQQQYPPQPGYMQPSPFGGSYGGAYNQPPQQKGKNGKGKKNEQGLGQPMQPPVQQPYGQGYGQQPQQPGQCASPCSQACAPACSSQCCGANNAFTAMQQPPSMTQTSCPGACPNSCAPVCSQKCCWDKRTTIPRPAAIPHPYQQYYY